MIGVVNKKARFVALVVGIQRTEAKRRQFFAGFVCRRYLQLIDVQYTRSGVFCDNNNTHDLLLYPCCACAHGVIRIEHDIMYNVNMKVETFLLHSA